jgi:hypothetical protein
MRSLTAEQLARVMNMRDGEDLNLVVSLLWLDNVYEMGFILWPGSQLGKKYCNRCAISLVLS